MLGTEMPQEKSDLENYLISTFSKVQDQYGQKLDILPALPTLVEILSDTSTSKKALADKKFTFIGEAACQFGVRCIVARNFSSYDDRILDALSKKFRALQQLNKLVIKGIQLKRHGAHKLPSTIIQTISGVLYIHFGTPAVEKFIENAVMEIASNELGEARVKLTNESNAVSQFHELVHKEGGTMEAQPLEAADKQWQMKIVAKLRPTAVLFSHARTASSKQKAKLAACQDVLKFLSDRKDVFDQLQLVNISSTDVHPLPIEVADYTKIVEPARSTITTKSTTYSATDVTESNESVHIPFFHGEDAIRQLSRLLLGDSGSDTSDDSSMSEGSPTKKRMRDVEQQVKQSQKQPQQPTGVKSMFGSAYYATTPPLSAVSPTPPTPKAPTTTATATAASIKPEPLTKTDPVELEAVNQNLLNSLSNPTSSPSTTRPSTQSATSSMDSLKTAPTSPLNNNVQQQPTTSTASEGGADMMEADDDEPSNPFTSIATATSTAICQQEIDPRIISYYKKIFGPHRSAMLQAMNMPGQCKSIFLSLTQQNTDKLIVESKTAQVGPPHAPVFSVVVILRSREYAVCTIKTEAVARRKKDAEMHAFHKLVCMMK